MKIDLHVHTKDRSDCALSTEEEQIKEAIKIGLSGIAITEHNRLLTPEHLNTLNRTYAPFKIFKGIEIKPLDAGSGEDVIVLGLDDDILQKQKWHYKDLHGFVRKAGGFLFIPHPYVYSEKIHMDIESFVPDAFEVHSKNIGRSDEGRIRGIAERLHTK